MLKTIIRHIGVVSSTMALSSGTLTKIIRHMPSDTMAIRHIDQTPFMVIVPVYNCALVNALDNMNHCA